MISEIIKNYNMSLDLETYWIPLQLEGIPGYRKAQEALSVQIIWDAVLGVLNGVIEIYVTNDTNSRSLLGSYNVNSISNRNDSLLINLTLNYSYMKIKYIKNGIIDGRLNAILKYGEVI